jgi:uncharacterized protein (UPF0332 family)
MPISPTEWLDYARTQVGAASEAAWRSAASRAYYGAYHATLPIATPLLGSDGGGSHERVIKALTNCRSNDVGPQRASALKSLGYLLSHARASRVAADYNTSVCFTGHEAAAAIDEANSVLAHIAANQAVLAP